MSDTPPPLSPNPTTQPAVPAKSGNGSKVGLGCGIGCLIALILGVVACVLVFGFVKGAIEDGVEKFTIDQPVAIVEPQFAPDQVQDASDRYEAFYAAMKAGQTPEHLVLSAQDINALLFNHSDFKAIAGMAKVDIEDNLLKSTVSVNLDDLEIPVKFIADAVAGRYFNGEVTFSIAMASGRPTAFVEELEVNGLNPPEQVMEGFRQENLLKEAQSDPNLKKFFDQISDLKIENNKLVIVPK